MSQNKCPLCEYNSHEIEEIIRLVKEVGVDRIRKAISTVEKSRNYR